MNDVYLLLTFLNNKIFCQGKMILLDSLITIAFLTLMPTVSITSALYPKAINQFLIKKGEK
jgi:hypothetical protein